MKVVNLAEYKIKKVMEETNKDPVIEKIDYILGAVIRPDIEPKKTKMKAIIERATETAKKVRKVLKQEFKGTKFSVTTNSGSIFVCWSGGPKEEEVNNLVSKFESASFDGMTDCEETTGYMWEGKLYYGAKYISTRREPN